MSDILQETKKLLADTLQLGDRVNQYSVETPLLGSIPEFDSMAVVTLITAIEDFYGVIVDDDEVSAETFETIGSLTRFIESKL